MALQKIVLTIAKQSAIEVKNILYKFNSTLPQINILDKISDNDIKIEFKVPEEICSRVIKKFVGSGFSVKPIDAYTKKILFKINKGTNNQYPVSGFKSSNEKENNIVTPKTGKEIISSVKKILDGQNKITSNNQKALKDAFDFYINKLIEDAFTSHSKAYDNIQELIEIASNKKLLSSPLFTISKTAGFSAVNICTQNPLNVGELINICNNRSVNSTVRAKAVAKFVEVVFQDKDFYETDLSIAVKRLNTRWLNTILDESGKDLSESEIKNFKKLQSFIARSKK